MKLSYILSALAVMAMLLVAPAVAAAGTYVALGDSLAYGIGASTPASKGYVGALYSSLHPDVQVDDLANFGQPGATSGSLRDFQLTAALAEINAGTDTKLVTIDIGGNDFIGAICNLDWDAPSCPFRDNFAATLDDLLAALDADPGTETLVTMAYYNPATGLGPPNETAIEGQLFGANGELNVSDNGADVGLNDVILQESRDRGLPMANPYEGFRNGGQALISDGTHPNDVGYAAITQAFCDLSEVLCDSEQPPTIDTDPPETTIGTRPPRKSSKHRVRVVFTSSETGSSYECSLDRRAFTSCSSPWRRQVRRGSHRFAVRAIDPAGNVDRTPAAIKFKIKKRP